MLLPEGADHERWDLVHRRHNAWLKGMIGGAGETTQGNHRLRDTVASILWSIDRPTAAQEALGHSSVDTTAKHYGKKIHVSPAMRAEMAAWTGGMTGFLKIWLTFNDPGQGVCYGRPVKAD
ncbi:MAG: hypothetical protein EOP86_19620 [Verrucomicrobiaceae bacterium]|nr:MAG: hypothetical protein EOP86_19620 [Verrucomicrobiaceae bacterium]